VTNRSERQTAARTPERTTRDDPPPQRTVEREQPRRDPPASTTNTSASNSGGPVTLAPNSGQSNPVPLSPASNPPPVQTANVEPSIVGSATPTQPQRAAGSVVWTQRPTTRRISDLYPRSALNDGVGGRVVMECRVLGDLSVSCSVVSETPSGVGFGRAALSASSSYRARPTLSDGSSAVGSTTRIAVNFQAPQR
jgi:protein TonB